MKSIEAGGRKVAVDDEGYLVDPDDWDEEVAKALAAREGLELGEEHWKVLRFMRDWLDEHQVMADARFVIWYLERDLGYGEAGRKRLFELFPYGHVRQVCKISGMRRPRAWSTG